MQGLQQAHYEILSIIFQNKFMKSNTNMEAMAKKKCETCRIKYKYCSCFLECTNFKNNLIEHKCLCRNKNYQQKLDEKLRERFFNTYKFSNHDKNKFTLLL